MSAWLFLLFLKRMAEFTRDETLIRRGKQLIRVGITVCVIMIVGMASQFAPDLFPKSMQAILGLMLICAAIYALLWLVSYSLMLVQLRNELLDLADAIARKLEDTGEAELLEPEI